VPRKTFVAGEILTAADVNANLMDQAVMTFAGTAARGSAIPSPSEGMVVYLSDTDRLEKYTGASWRSVTSVSDMPVGSVIQAVTATTATTVNTTSSSFQTTNLSAAITPISSSNKVLILTTTTGYASGGAAGNGPIFSLFRGTTAGTNLGNGNSGFGRAQNDASVSRINVHLSFLDSPATTSSQTYTLAFRSPNGSNNVTAHADSGTATMTLLEVVA